MDTAYIIIAKYFIVIPVLVVLFVLWTQSAKDRLSFIKLLITGGIISIVLAKIGNHVITDPRPFVEGHFKPLISHGPDNGFPSDHTLLAAFLGFALLTVRKYLGWGTLAVALLIGLSRMAVGVHHSWDIIGSFVCAGLGCLIAILVRRFWRERAGSSVKS